MTLRLAQVLDLMGWVRSRSHQDVVRITAERAAGLSFGDTGRRRPSTSGSLYRCSDAIASRAVLARVGVRHAGYTFQ